MRNDTRFRLRILVLDTAILIATILVLVFLAAKMGRCIWCYSDVCYTQQECGPDCVCIIAGTDPLGVCIGVDEGDLEDEEDEPWVKR